MRRVYQIGAVLLVAVSCAAAKPKKNKKGASEPVAPPVGWHQEDGARGACWYPPEWDKLGTIDRRAARDEALSAMVGQWTGQRDDGVAFDERVATDVETVLLGYPEKIERVAAENLAWCKKAMTGSGTDAWLAWLTKLPHELTKDECLTPLDQDMYMYLEVTTGWQGGRAICADDVVRIKASAGDYYRVEKNGPWINAAGDTSRPATGDYPCNHEGCYVGQLVLRFRGRSGIEIVRPIGLELVFDPPEHGTIEYMVNDIDLSDNEFKVERGMVHHTAVSYLPVHD